MGQNDKLFDEPKCSLNFLIFFLFSVVNTLDIHLPILEITEQELYKNDYRCL